MGEKNIKYKPLIKEENMILRLVHIKLGLVKNFVKALNRDSDAFKYLHTIFPHFSNAKIKEGIFLGPQMRKLLNDNQFESSLSEIEAAAWNSFRLVVLLSG